MHRLTSILVGLALILAAACQAPTDTDSSPETITFEGRLLGASGEAPRAAHVLVKELEKYDTVASVDVDADGSFRLDVPRGGPFKVQVATANHRRLRFPLVVNDDIETISVELQLASNVKAEPEDVKIEVDDEDPAAMERRDDGTFVYRIEEPGEQVAYRILAASPDGLPVAGTQADEYELELKGIPLYRSIVRTAGEAIEVVFDPSQVAATGEDLPRLVATNDATLAGIFAVEIARDKGRTKMKEVMVAGGEPKPAELLADTLAEIRARFADEASPTALRIYAATQLLDAFFRETVTDEERGAALELLPADSPNWLLAEWSIRSLDPEKYGDVLERLRTENPSGRVRALALNGLIRKAKKDDDRPRWKELYAELETYAELGPGIQGFLVTLNPESRIVVGKSVPEFETALLDGTYQGSDTVSDASLAGTYYLVDFWGTWCAPCVAEMPTLHEAWDKYKDEDFQILSLAVYDDVEDVREFRSDKWPMPWLNAHVDTEIEDNLVEKFEVTGYPTTILIDPQGRITEIGLRGDRLLEDLEKRFEG